MHNQECHLMRLDNPIIGTKGYDVLLGLNLDIPDPFISLADCTDEATLTSPKRGLLIRTGHHKELPIREVPK